MKTVLFNITQRNKTNDAMASFHDELVRELLKVSIGVNKNSGVMGDIDSFGRLFYVPSFEYIVTCTNEAVKFVEAIAIRYCKRLGMDYCFARVAECNVEELNKEGE